MSESATIRITNLDFNASPGACSSATLTLVQPAPSWITISNNDITITSPQPGGVVLNYTLDSADYKLTNATFTPPAPAEFNGISVSRSGDISTLTVNDADFQQGSSKEESYTYVINVLRVSDQTPGVIDPRITNDF